MSRVINATQPEPEESERLFSSNSAYDSVTYDLMETRLSVTEAEVKG